VRHCLFYREHAESTGITALIGEYRVKCLFQSTAWNLREACINKVQLMLDEFASSVGIQACVAPLLSIVRIGIEDKMQQVFFSAMSLLEAVLIATKRQKLSKGVVAPLVESTINALIEKMSDANARIRDGSKRGMEMLSASPNVGPHVVATHTLKPMTQKQKTGWRPLHNRLTLLSDVVSAHGVGPASGVSIDAVLGFLKSNSAFTHSNGDVRDACRDVCVAVAKSAGTIDVVNSYLTELRQSQKDEYKAAFLKAGLVVGPAGVGGPPGALGPPGPGGAAAANTENSPRGGAAGKQASGATNASPAPSRKSAAEAKGQPSQQQQQQAKQQQQQATSPRHSQAPQNHPQDHVSHQSHLHDGGAKHEPGEGEDFTCNFCGAGDELWDEDALDMHYLRDCPLLAPCPACGQVYFIISPSSGVSQFWICRFLRSLHYQTIF
jgi:hypothetical protein